MKIKQIIIKAYLLLACLILSLFRGRADKGSGPGKFLIIQSAKLGDMVCTTPMFRAIKRRYPEAKVIVAGNAVNKELLAGNKDVDSYLVFNKQSLFRLIPILKKEKIGFACITSPSFENLATAYLAGVSKIVVPVVRGGFSPYETRSFKLLRHLAISVTHRMGHYAPGEYLKMLEPAEIYEDNTQKHLVYSNDAEREVDNFLTANGIYDGDFVVGLAPSAGNKIKLWPTERFVKVADYLISKYYAKVILIGSKYDKDQADEFLRGLANKDKIIDTVGKFSIDYLKALTARMSLLIAVDSGPIYVAEAFNVPTVDITGPFDEREQVPIGPRHKVVAVKRENPQLHIMNASMYDVKEARKQIEDITVEMVINEINNLIEVIRNKS